MVARATVTAPWRVCAATAGHEREHGSDEAPAVGYLGSSNARAIDEAMEANGYRAMDVESGRRGSAQAAAHAGIG